MSTIILIIGLMIFISHFLAVLFRRTNIPDVLVLMVIGLVAGPLLGWVSPEDFGKVGPVIATIALVVILFESGTSLRLDVMGKSLGTTGKLAFGCFIATGAIVTSVAMAALAMPLLSALLLGVILAGTSSAVVIPMVESLRLKEDAATVLVLESALTDVLCIVGVFALLHVVTDGGVDPGKLVGGVLSALIFAAIIGILGGIGWLLILGKVRDFPNTISTTIAYAFLIYGLSEFLGFSGAIAAMTLGLTLTNFDQRWLSRFKGLDRQIDALTPMDIAFYREAVFLLKTYFFVYLGISIQFSDSILSLVALGMMALVFLMRIVLTRFVFAAKSFSRRDSAFASMLAPKGLAAAVLAGLPLQYGVTEGALIRDTTYMVVLVSISLCALLIISYSARPVRTLYGLMLGKQIPTGTPASEQA
jgi:NhaP-type Na+/H+ or K+/H+ antiporter